MMAEIIKPKGEITPGNTISKVEQDMNLRGHLLMLLEAMQYGGPIKHLGNASLRDLVEEQKIVFLKKLRAQNDRSQQA